MSDEQTQATAVHVGLMCADHIPQSAEQLEFAALRALYKLRFGGGYMCHSSNSESDGWERETTLQRVPAPMLRAWLRVTSAELVSVMDLLIVQNHVTRSVGKLSLPFGRKTTDSTEWALKKPTGEEVRIVRLRGGPIWALSVAHNTLGRLVPNDPEPVSLAQYPPNRVPHYALTKCGLERYTQLMGNRAEVDTPTSGSGAHDGVTTRRPPRRRGRPKLPAGERKVDCRVLDAWNSGSYLTYAELEREMGLEPGEAEQRIRRHRKFVERQANKGGSGSA